MRGRVHRSRVTHDRWLVSYADFITLLFAFFVVLYAFAKADQKKQAQVSVAIDSAFHALSALPVGFVGPASGSEAASRHDQSEMNLDQTAREEIVSPAKVAIDLDQIRRVLEQTLSTQIAEHAVSIRMGREGLV